MKKVLLLTWALIMSIGLFAQSNDIESLKKWVTDEINNNYAKDAQNTVGQKVSDVKVAFKGNTFVISETNISTDYGVRKYKIVATIPLNKISEIPMFTESIDISDNTNLDITIMTKGDEDIIEKQTGDDGDTMTNNFGNHSIYMKLSYGTEKVNKIISALLTIAKASK